MNPVGQAAIGFDSDEGVAAHHGPLDAELPHFSQRQLRAAHLRRQHQHIHARAAHPLQIRLQRSGGGQVRILFDHHASEP